MYTSLGCWKLHELPNDEWWIIDRRTGAAHRVGSATGATLWRQHDLLDVPIGRAIAEARARAAEATGHFIDLRVMEITTRYISADPGQIAELQSLHGAAQPRLRATPDALVRLSPGANIERIYRTVDEPRVGVEIRDGEKAEFRPASAAVPSFPPLELKYFADQFSVMHAALVKSPRGNIMICGGRKAGKTTAALVAERTGLGTVLTDEMTIIDGSGNGCGVPLPIRERDGDSRIARVLKPVDGIGELVPIAHVVCLRGANDVEYVHLAGVEKSLSAVAPHVRAISGELALATSQLLGMVTHARAWSWSVRAWPDLTGDLEKGLRALIAS